MAHGRDVAAKASQIRADALELVRQLLAGACPAAELEERAQALDRQIQALAGQPGQGAPDVQRALSDADLDIGFVFAGGKGASSAAAQQLVSERDARKPR